MKNALKICAISAVLVPLCGCVATQQDMLQMQSQMDDLNSNITSMQKNQADLSLKIDSLSSNLNIFSETLKDITTQMARLSERLDELDAVIYKRVNAIGATIKKQQEDVESALLPAKLYNDAYNAYLGNSLDVAISGYRTYLSKFPSGDMAESAYYYMGESFYLKEKWHEASLCYATVLDKFPRSSRVPIARLKYAMTLLKLPENKKDEATRYLESIIRDYPKSQEADTARLSISKLTQKKIEPSPDKPKPSSARHKPKPARTN